MYVYDRYTNLITVFPSACMEKIYNFVLHRYVSDVYLKKIFFLNFRFKNVIIINDNGLLVIFVDNYIKDLRFGPIILSD